MTQRFSIIFILLFLYVPIAIIVVFSFNASANLSTFSGFTLDWYEKAFGNRLAKQAVTNSLIISLSSATVSTLIGVSTAIGLRSISKTWQNIIRVSLFVGLTIPGIVIGLAALIAFSTSFSFIEKVISSLMQLEGFRIRGLGLPTVIAAHSLFCTALVVELVLVRLKQMPPNIVEASYDLGVSPGKTIILVVLPYLRPAMLASFLVSMIFSFDEFIIAFFVSGAEPTLPVYLFGFVRRGATPEINAIATLVLGFTIALALLSLVVSKPLLSSRKKS